MLQCATTRHNDPLRARWAFPRRVLYLSAGQKPRAHGTSGDHPAGKSGRTHSAVASERCGCKSDRECVGGHEVAPLQTPLVRRHSGRALDRHSGRMGQPSSKPRVCGFTLQVDAKKDERHHFCRRPLNPVLMLGNGKKHSSVLHRCFFSLLALSGPLSFSWLEYRLSFWLFFVKPTTRLVFSPLFPCLIVSERVRGEVSSHLHKINYFSLQLVCCFGVIILT